VASVSRFMFVVLVDTFSYLLFGITTISHTKQALDLDPPVIIKRVSAATTAAQPVLQ